MHCTLCWVSWEYRTWNRLPNIQHNDHSYSLQTKKTFLCPMLYNSKWLFLIVDPFHYKPKLSRAKNDFKFDFHDLTGLIHKSLAIDSQAQAEKSNNLFLLVIHQNRALFGLRSIQSARQCFFLSLNLYAHLANG